jgi:hypothetical protein
VTGIGESDQAQHPVIAHRLDIARLIRVIGSPHLQRGTVKFDDLSNGVTLKQDERGIVVFAERDQFRGLSVVNGIGVVGQGCSGEPLALGIAGEYKVSQIVGALRITPISRTRR